MVRRLMVRSQSKRRSVRMRGSILSNFRVWQKKLKQQIFLGRNLNPYLYPIPVFLQRSLEKNDILHLLRVAEIHHHQDVPLLWNFLDKTCWVDALCFLVQWKLHDTASFKYVQSKVDFTIVWNREKVVFTAIQYNNIDALINLSSDFGCINNSSGRYNCILETLLSQQPQFYNCINTWGVTSVQNISSCLLYLVHNLAPQPYFWAWYEQFDGALHNRCVNEFSSHFRFVQTPYEFKEFVAAQHDNPVLTRYAPFLATQWKTSAGFECNFDENNLVFYSTPCAANSALIAVLSAISASMFIYVIAPYIEVEQHFIWALSTHDFDLAALLLPFVPASLAYCGMDTPSATTHPVLYNQMLTWKLTQACQSEGRHINERVRKI